MKLYQFKVALDFDKNTNRIIEILGSQTLEKFHDIIFTAFDRYDEHLYSFYLTKKSVASERQRHKFPEYISPFGLEEDNLFDDDEPAKDASKAKIESLGLKEKDKLYYLFDFGDSWWHDITLLSITETDNKKGYPKITKKVGESPDQYEFEEDDDDYDDEEEFDDENDYND